MVHSEPRNAQEARGKMADIGVSNPQQNSGGGSGGGSRGSTPAGQPNKRLLIYAAAAVGGIILLGRKGGGSSATPQSANGLQTYPYVDPSMFNQAPIQPGDASGNSNGSGSGSGSGAGSGSGSDGGGGGAFGGGGVFGGGGGDTFNNPVAGDETNTTTNTTTNTSNNYGQPAPAPGRPSPVGKPFTPHPTTYRGAGALTAPSGAHKPAAPSGFKSVGTGGGGWVFTPVAPKTAPKGKPAPVSVKTGKPQAKANATGRGTKKNSPAAVANPMALGGGSGVVVMGRQFPGAVSHRMGPPRIGPDGVPSRVVTVDYGGHTDTHMVVGNGERWLDSIPGHNPPSRGIPRVTAPIPV